MSGNKRSWKFRFLLGALAVVILGSTQLYGQSQAITATISGVILDPAGLAISGARVTLSSPERGITRTATTEANGIYTFTLLPPSVYRLEVEAKGFKHYKQFGISLDPGQTAEENISLMVGGVTESIEITSQAPLLNAENANISSDVSAR